MGGVGGGLKVHPGTGTVATSVVPSLQFSSLHLPPENKSGRLSQGRPLAQHTVGAH